MQSDDDSEVTDSDNEDTHDHPEEFKAWKQRQQKEKELSSQQKKELQRQKERQRQEDLENERLYQQYLQRRHRAGAMESSEWSSSSTHDAMNNPLHGWPLRKTRQSQQRHPLRRPTFSQRYVPVQFSGAPASTASHAPVSLRPLFSDPPLTPFQQAMANQRQQQQQSQW